MPGFTGKAIERQSLLGYGALRPFLLLPPNDRVFYAAAAAASALRVGTAMTLQPTAATGTVGTTRRGFGGASSVHVSIITATSYAAGDSITLEIVGANEFYEDHRERVTLAHPAVTVRTVSCFSRVDSITVVAKAQLAGATPTIGAGIGDNSATPAILIPNPIPGFTNLNYLLNTLSANPVLHASGAPFGTTPDGLPGRYLVLNYATTAPGDTIRPVGITFINANRDALG